MRDLSRLGSLGSLSGAQRRLLGVLAMISFACLLVGFLTGYVHSAAEDVGELVAASPMPLPRDVAIARALPVLEAYQHWGEYTETSATSARAARDAERSGETDLSLSFSLVGVEELDQSGVRMALLLFLDDGPIGAQRLASVPDAENIIRIRKGQRLFDRVSAGEILLDSITLTGSLDPVAADADSARLELGARPGEAHTWRLLMYAGTR